MFDDIGVVIPARMGSSRIREKAILPFADTNLLEWKINQLKEKTNDALFSVNLLKEYFWNNERPINYQADKNHTISHELPNIYRVTNGLYMIDKKSILEEKYFLAQNPYKFVVSKIARIDIDEMEDYRIAKFYYEKCVKAK